MAVGTEDLPSRCLSLLEEVKGLLAGPHQQSHRAIFQFKTREHTTFLSCFYNCGMCYLMSPENSFTKCQAGTKKVVFSSKVSFDDVKEKREC